MGSTEKSKSQLNQIREKYKLTVEEAGELMKLSDLSGSFSVSLWNNYLDAFEAYEIVSKYAPTFQERMKLLEETKAKHPKENILYIAKEVAWQTWYRNYKARIKPEYKSRCKYCGNDESVLHTGRIGIYEWTCNGSYSCSIRWHVDQLKVKCEIKYAKSVKVEVESGI